MLCKKVDDKKNEGKVESPALNYENVVPANLRFFFRTRIVLMNQETAMSRATIAAV